MFSWEYFSSQLSGDFYVRPTGYQLEPYFYFPLRPSTSRTAPTRQEIFSASCWCYCSLLRFKCVRESVCVRCACDVRLRLCDECVLVITTTSRFSSTLNCSRSRPCFFPGRRIGSDRNNDNRYNYTQRRRINNSDNIILSRVQLSMSS